jgi:hypothetical protein
MIQQFEQAVGQLRDALVRRRLRQSWTNSRAKKTGKVMLFLGFPLLGRQHVSKHHKQSKIVRNLQDPAE